MNLLAELDFAMVITTVRPPTAAVRQWAERLDSVPKSQLIVVGDAKGPRIYDTPSTEFLAYCDQDAMGLSVAAELPRNHYARKNLGYLRAIARGAVCIYETDDDNAPKDDWKPRDLEAQVEVCAEAPGWVNVYRHFSSEVIWPRGMPLADANRSDSVDVLDGLAPGVRFQAPVQQGLADGSPDVDAVWRLLLDRPVAFSQAPSLMLTKGQWCPFNSQSTWWWPDAFPLMYLPTTCTFRTTDIWRALVAQRCLWEFGRGVVFHAAEVYQDRNAHDWLKDFKDEIPGYLHNKAIARCLAELNLDGGTDGVAANVNTCYSALVRDGYLDVSELRILEVFLENLERVQRTPRTKRGPLQVES